MSIIAHPTNENLRIRTEIEDGPSKPYNDGGFPIWRMESGRYTGAGRAVQETDITSYVTPHELDHAIERMYSDAWSYPKIERYLRIFWGATFVQWWHSGSYMYVTTDPADWRRTVGVDEEATKRHGYSEHPFTEWEAWVEGLVHIAWPERRVWQRTTTRTWDPGQAENPEDPESSDEIGEDTDDGYAWIDAEDDGPVGGFYGDVNQDMAANMAWQFGWEIPGGHKFEITED
jgi:hypothetical protein